MSEMDNQYQSLLDESSADSILKKMSVPGLCRKWSGRFAVIIKDLAKEQNLDLEVECREVDVTYGLSHTFVRIRINGEKSYLCDGVGVGGHEPYFGSENEAPSHLRDSRIDYIELIKLG